MKQLSLETLSLEIQDIAFPEGFGVGRNRDFVCFVPGGLPGDVVRVEMVRKNRRFGYAKIVEVERESPFRVAPACPHAGECGGCLFQNLRYEKQLELKQNYLLHTLRRIGNVPIESVQVEPIVPSVEKYYYRSKVELFFAERGQARLGFRERVSPLEPYTGRLVAVGQCPIFSRSLERLLPVFSEFAGRVGASASGRGTSGAVLKRLIVREAKWNGRLMVSLVVAGNGMAEIPWLLREIQKSLPEVASFWVIGDRKKEVLFGAPYLDEMFGHLTFRVYPQTFSQPNTRMAERLYRSITELCQATAGDRVLGLYCGTGPIEISLSPFARKIVGIDSDAGNITTAIENCRINRVRNCQFYRQTAEQASNLNVAGPFDLVVVDPPRAGLTTQALSFIQSLAAGRLVYVSCNPSTLARDLKRLREGRFVARRIIPFDFFPHGGHLETLVLLEKDRLAG